MIRITTDITLGCEGVWWIDLAQDRVQLYTRPCGSVRDREYLDELCDRQMLALTALCGVSCMSG